MSQNEDNKNEGFDLGRLIEKNENRVNGLVYFGASILIIIVGLRGLGTIAGEIPIVPRFLIAPDNKIDPNFVMAALFLEFALLVLMAVVNYLKPVHLDDHSEPGEDDRVSYAAPYVSEEDVVKIEKRVKEVKRAIEDIQKLGQEKLVMVNGIIDQFDAINKKINRIQAEALSSLAGIKDAAKN